MKRILFSAAVLVCALVCANGQEVHTEWYDVDRVEVYKSINLDDYSQLYILPIKESGLVITGKDKEVAKMRKAIDEFPEHIKHQISARYENLEINIVETLPEGLTDKALVLDLDIVSFDQGSRAARAWGGFGAGAQSTELAGDCKDGAGNMIFHFQHRRLNSAMGQLSNDYYPVISKTERVLGSDICNIFNAMAGKKQTKVVK